MSQEKLYVLVGMRRDHVFGTLKQIRAELLEHRRGVDYYDNLSHNVDAGNINMYEVSNKVPIKITMPFINIKLKENTHESERKST